MAVARMCRRGGNKPSADSRPRLQATRRKLPWPRNSPRCPATPSGCAGAATTTAPPTTCAAATARTALPTRWSCSGKGGVSGMLRRITGRKSSLSGIAGRKQCRTSDRSAHQQLTEPSADSDSLQVVRRHCRLIIHSATTILMIQPVPMHTARNNSPCSSGHTDHGMWVNTCVPAPMPSA